MSSDVELFGFQFPFVHGGLDSPQDEYYLLVHGGIRSGKTRAGAYRLIAYHLKYPNANFLIVAPINDTLRDSTMKTLFDVLNEIGWVYGKDYEYNKTERILYFLRTRAVAFCRSGEEPKNIRGMTIASAWIDEGGDTTTEVFERCLERLSQPGYPHQLWVTTTPGYFDHWTREYWYERDHSEEESTFIAYGAKVADNPYGGEKIDRRLREIWGENSPMYRREALGEYVVVEGLVYPSFSKEKHVVAERDWPSKPVDVVAGVDFGWTAPTAILVVGQDRAGRTYIMDEWFRPHAHEDEMCEANVTFRERYNIRTFITDSADPRLRAVMKRDPYYLHAVPCTKEQVVNTNPFSGIALCTAAINKTMPDGSQGFFVSPKCRNFVREMSNYVYEKNRDGVELSERPRKKDDHLPDDFRYVMIHLSNKRYPIWYPEDDKPTIYMPLGTTFVNTPRGVPAYAIGSLPAPGWG